MKVSKNNSLKAMGLFAAGMLFALPCFADDSALNSGDTSWMLISSAIVLMMSIPGLALFYGGLVRKDNVLATLMQTFIVVCITAVVWPVISYSLAFSGGSSPYIGDLSKLMLHGVGKDTLSGSIPETVFIMFQFTFAAITAAILLGSVADRIHFSAVVLFIPLWLIFVYSPIAHMVWGPGGLFGGIGIENYEGFMGLGPTLDFAGGTVVHINSGFAGLVAALVIGKRTSVAGRVEPPYNLVFSVLGAALLWVGWFGFNAGSALTSGAGAGMAMLVTNTSAAAAALAWCVIEWLHKGKPSVTGAISGAVAGLVAITPASGFVGVAASIIFGIVVSLVCYVAVAYLKKRLKYDDSLDAFGLHGVGGVVGALMTGVFAEQAIGGVPGVLEGNMNQLFSQAACVIFTIVYTVIVTYIILKIVDKLVGLRVSKEVELSGLDLALHGEKIHH